MPGNKLKEAVARNPVIWASAFLFLFSVAIYSGALNHGFVWDDEGVFTDAPEIREFSNIPSFFAKPLILGESERPDTDSDLRIRYYRPLLSTLHVFEYHWFGSNPLGYKLVNLLFNGAVVVCGFLLVRALTGELGIAFLAALLYAANPARGEVVYWAYSDSHIFAAFFSLLVLLAYHRGRFFVALGLTAVGLSFQEGVILVVGALLLYQLTIVEERGRGWTRLVPFFALAIIYLGVRRLVAGTLSFADLDLLYRLRAAAYLLVKHLQICFVTDAPVTMYRYVPGMFDAGGVTTPAIMLGAMLFLLAGGGLWWWRRNWFFWYAWFVVWITLSFNVGGYANYLMAEKSLYLAALGPCVLLAAVVLNTRRYRFAGLVLFLMLLSYQTWVTVERGRYWSDTITYLEKLLEFEADYDVAQYQIAVEYLKAERYEDAIKQLDALYRARPDAIRRIKYLQTDIYEKWGRSLAEKGDLDKALLALNKAKQSSPGHSVIYNSLGVVYFMRGDRNQAVHNWQTALRLDPDNIEARVNLERLGQGGSRLE